MKISGLANQWKTRDGLFANFDTEPYVNADGRLDIRGPMIKDLLTTLESRNGRDVYVGTSHSLLNFNTRDVSCDSDRVPSFARVYITWGLPSHDCWVFRVSARKLDRGRPTDIWYDIHCAHVATAADRIVDALAYADLPQTRI
ncbi:hypothetical protein Pla22_34010 [Rubripirellula amarantea]|uniref:Uncharacterized protein n=1 Tax=Rubripirellula amarantea TaxID=2527999 RepID=A0A5C5WIT7_9BACT|nr:hypothetical protein Pla22_34010 [Rubripirellula amarantea]